MHVWQFWTWQCSHEVLGGLRCYYLQPLFGYLGPLHTWAKSRNHEIVRAQMKVSRGCPNTSKHYVVWSRTLKCSVKSYVTGPQPNAISIHFYSCGSSHIIVRISQWLRAFGLPWSSGFVLGLLPIGEFWEQFMCPWNMIYPMACRNLCRLYIHLASTYSIGPSSILWSELGPAPPSPPMRVLEV